MEGYRDLSAQYDVGLVGGDTTASDSGWNLFTFNPALKAEGKNPFTLTSKAGKMDKYQEFLANETRYSRLSRAFPDRAKALFEKNQEAAEARYTHLTKLVDLYK